MVEKSGAAPKILIVDDREENLILLENIIGDLNAELIRAMSGADALRRILEHEFALVLLDVQMPDMDGFETAELIRCNSRSSRVPIIFITAISKEKKYIFKGYDTGAVDYMHKPLDPDILRSKTTVFIELFEQKAELKRINAELNAANARIIEQQTCVVEEERLKVLLQMAGATAHEFSQPLMMMAGNIEMLEMDMDDPEKRQHHLSKIKKAGKHISDIVAKIRNIPLDVTLGKETTPAPLGIEKEMRFLSVEDSDIDFQLLSSYFTGDDKVVLERAGTIAEGLRMLEDDVFDLVFMDFQLPDGTGLEFIKEMKSRGVDIPVVAITGFGDDTIASGLMRAGAYDYLNKARINRESIQRIIATTLERFRLKKEIESAMKTMAEMSVRDDLTGLYNRRYMKDAIEQEFKRSARYGSDLSCLILDLDYFKLINDTHGHLCGDVILKQFAKRLLKYTRESDYAFRYGGEEFMLLLPQTDMEGAMKTAENIRDYCWKESYTYENLSISVTVSIGFACVEECKPEHSRELIAFADKALYQAKADGRNCVRVFKRDMGAINESMGYYWGKGVEYFKANLAAVLEKTKKASINSIETLIRDAGGDYLESQTRRITTFITLFGDKLNLARQDTGAIIKAAVLHDVFRILLGEEILKKANTLTEHEEAKIKNHPYMLVELTDLFDCFAREKTVLLSHHENFDGTGYPEGLQGKEIPLGARVFAISNAFLSMTSDRPYREKADPETVVDELVENAGSQFDPRLVHQFLEVIWDNKLLEIRDEVINGAKQKLKPMME